MFHDELLPQCSSWQVSCQIPGWYRPRTCGAGSRGSASLPPAMADHVPYRVRVRIGSVGTRSLCDPALHVSTPFSLQPGLFYVHKLRERARSARRDSTIRLRSGQRLEPFAYNGRCKFPNKIGIYSSYGRSYKCLTLVYEPSLKAR